MLRKLAFLTIVVMILGTTLPMATPAYAQTPEEWFAQAGEPYQGVTIKGVSERTAPSQFMLNSMVPGFTEATGINVEFELTSWDEMYEKEIKDMESGAGIYDFVYIEQDFIFAALEKNWLTDLTQLTADNPDLLYPGNDVGDFTSFADKSSAEGQFLADETAVKRDGRLQKRSASHLLFENSAPFMGSGISDDIHCTADRRSGQIHSGKTSLNLNG